MQPTKLVDAWLRPTKGALDNARGAVINLAGAVADRMVLTTDSDVDEDSQGALRRLTRTECYDLLRRREVGRLAYIARAGVPDIVPVNYVLDGEDVVFRSGPGPKLQAAERRELVAFEVDDVDEAAHTGVSVVVVGRAIRQPDSDDGPQAWADGPRRHLVRIRPMRVTGRSLS